MLGSAQNAAHDHGFAPPGTPAGIKLVLPLGFHKNGVLAYGQADEANYLNGLSYVNIHTAGFGGGEIRGQIVPAGNNPTIYCTAKVNSQGCLPQIGFTGHPTLGGPDDFHITCTQVLNNKAGLLYWGLRPNAAPFQGGTQCIGSPTRRTPVQNSSGNPPPDDCSGAYDHHFSDAYMASVGLTPGQSAYAEYWTRDPASPSTTGLSDAVGFIVQ
jgi:hypothetical protein